MESVKIVFIFAAQFQNPLLPDQEQKQECVAWEGQTKLKQISSYISLHTLVNYGNSPKNLTAEYRKPLTHSVSQQVLRNPHRYRYDRYDKTTSLPAAMPHFNFQIKIFRKTFCVLFSRTVMAYIQRLSYFGPNPHLLFVLHVDYRVDNTASNYELILRAKLII